MIKLTKFDPFTCTELGPVWFAWDTIGRVEPDWASREGERGSVLYRKGDPVLERVREAPEQVLELLRAEELRANPLIVVRSDITDEQHDAAVKALEELRGAGLWVGIEGKDS